MKYFDDAGCVAIDAATANLLGFKTMTGPNAGGVKYQGVSTSGWSHSLAQSPSYPMANIANGASQPGGDMVIVGIASIHADSTTSSTDPVYFFIDDGISGTSADVINRLSKLPWFTVFGNALASTTDKYEVVLQIQKAGMWFLTEGGIPPTGRVCKLNFDFQYNDCWDGLSTAVAGASDEVHSITQYSSVFPDGDFINQDNRNSTTGPWMSYWDCTDGYSLGVSGGKSYINVADNILPSAQTTDEITIEYVGQGSSAGISYPFDASGGDGVGLKVRPYAGPPTNNSVFEWGVSGFGSVLSNIGVNLQANRHHWIGTANTVTDISSMYFCDSTDVAGNGWGNIGNGDTSAAMVLIGTNLKLGTNTTNDSSGARWPGWFSMFRIYDQVITATQAEIMWEHQKYSVLS